MTTKSRLYAKCVRPLLEKDPGTFHFGRQVTPATLDVVTTHGVAPGAPCLCCERDYEEKVQDHARQVEHAARYNEAPPEAPAKPRRARLEDAPCYVALLAEATARGLPHNYGTDLTDHDRWGLGIRHLRGDHAGFAWCLRESGTQLIQVRAPRRGDTSTPAEDVDSVQRAFSGPLLWYVCRGTDFETISPVTHKEALEWVRAECWKLSEAEKASAGVTS